MIAGMTPSPDPAFGQAVHNPRAKHPGTATWRCTGFGQGSA